jgi:hypothetical protein
MAGEERPSGKNLDRDHPASMANGAFSQRMARESLISITIVLRFRRGGRTFTRRMYAEKLAAPTTAILIRARSVVQVHPGPPSQSPNNYAAILTFPPSEDFPGNPICQPFFNFTIGQMELHSGVKTLRLKAKRLASIRLCRERCRVTKSVEHSARHCKAVEGAGSRFGQFPGRSSLG